MSFHARLTRAYMRTVQTKVQRSGQAPDVSSDARIEEAAVIQKITVSESSNR
jgi:hypothetical protein